ncbi:MAG: ParA family protein [Anaerolineae bacterium]|jgi:chromosome partitioning protein
MATVIAIGNQKGGVAKTTTCLSLGACLAEADKLVLAIDLDSQANLTLSVGLNPEELRRTVDDAFLGNASLVSVSRETPIFGLDIVPASQRLMLLDKVFYGRKGFEFHLRRRLEAMGDGLYDVVLLDCPPSCGTLTISALTAADLLIIPVQAEYYAACSLRRIIELASTVRRRTNPRLIYRILVTMYDRRNRICRFVLEQMRKGLSSTLLETIIEVDTKLRESPAFGQPITSYAPKTRGTRQYRALAQELMDDAIIWT